MIQNQLVRKPEDFEAESVKISVALGIFSDHFRCLMDRTVQFDNKAFLNTAEVGNVIPYLVLPPEFEAKALPITQQLPRDVLRRCLLLPKLPCTLH
jgi:hypothetical protein